MKESALDTNQVFHVSSRIAYRKIGGQIVIVHAGAERMITLNSTGTVIWELLGGKTVEAIARNIAELFEVDFEEALKDTVDFLKMMHERGLVEMKRTDSA
jgi:hypothetical protein